MQCEAHRSIIRITQEQHLASSATRHTPHTIPPPLRCVTYNRSGEVPGLVWNVLFDWSKAKLTVRYVNIYYDMLFITHLKSTSFSIINRSSLVLSPEIFWVTIHYFVIRVTWLVKLPYLGLDERWIGCSIFSNREMHHLTSVHPVSGTHTASSLTDTCETLLRVKAVRLPTRLLYSI